MRTQEAPGRADSSAESTPPEHRHWPHAASMAVAFRPYSVLSAELALRRIDLGPDDPRHRSMPGARPGDPSRAARLTTTGAANNLTPPPVRPSDLKSSARPEARDGQRSEDCDALQKGLRLAGCVATLPTKFPRPRPWQAHPVRALEARRQGYTSGSPPAHRSDKRPGRVAIGRYVDRHQASGLPVGPRSCVSVDRVGHNARGGRGVRWAILRGTSRPFFRAGRKRPGPLWAAALCEGCEQDARALQHGSAGLSSGITREKLQWPLQDPSVGILRLHRLRTHWPEAPSQMAGKGNRPNWSGDKHQRLVGEIR